MPWSDQRLIELRRWLHQHPELSCHEHQTARFLAARLEELGLAPRVGLDGAETGVVVDLVGAHPGPTYAWRADTDALPIAEETGASYASCNAGVMHACGHDVHTTIGLGLAAALVERRGELRGAVRFIFQPAEEGAPGLGVVGAEAMARAGVLEGVEGVLGLHCMPDMAAGEVGALSRAVWAGSDAWRLTIHGKQSHGAYPHDGVDPIYVAGHVLIGLQSIPGRVVDAREACVVSAGSVHAGEAFNVIPGEARLVGLVRCFDEGVREQALEALRRMVEGICASFGARAELALSRGAFPVVNDAALVARASEALRSSEALRALGGRVVEGRPQLGAEDFASFSRRCPSAYFLLGVRDEARGIVHPIHSPRFDVDERCIPLAVGAFSEALVSLVNGGRGVL